MMDEIDLLRRHLDATVEAEPDLERARQQLLAAIDEEPGSISRRRAAGPRAVRYRRMGVTAGGLVTVAVAAAVTLLVLSVPSSTPRHVAATTTTTVPPPRSAAGKELDAIASRVASETVPSLQGEQLLYSELQLSADASVDGDHTTATATVVMTVKKWSSPTGHTCVSVTPQPAQFGSPADQAAWTGLDLRTTPTPSTVNACLQETAGTPDAITGAGQLIDVASLATDPATLAKELESGTTGVAALDQLEVGGSPANAGLHRAAMLLIGPVTGATPEFYGTLYQAIAQLPGIVATGPATAHDGRAGEGFAAAPGPAEPTMIVDPTTGQLLEVRALEIHSFLSTVALHYVAGPLKVSSYSTGLQWLDPAGPPSVVPFSSLPTTLPEYVFATSKAGVTSIQLTPVIDHVDQDYGASPVSSDSHYPGVEDGSPSPGEFTWSFSPGSTAPTQLAQALQATGLFAEVSVI